MAVPGPTWGEMLRAPVNKDSLTSASSLISLAIRPRKFGARAAAVDTLPVQLGALFQASQSVLCLLDATGAVRAITPNAARILGEACDRAAELGITTVELLQPDNIFEVQSVLDDLSRTE